MDRLPSTIRPAAGFRDGELRYRVGAPTQRPRSNGPARVLLALALIACAWPALLVAGVIVAQWWGWAIGAK